VGALMSTLNGARAVEGVDHGLPVLAWAKGDVRLSLGPSRRAIPPSSFSVVASRWEKLTSGNVSQALGVWATS
jgi:hypothetical protein